MPLCARLEASADADTLWRWLLYNTIQYNAPMLHGCYSFT